MVASTKRENEYILGKIVLKDKCVRGLLPQQASHTLRSKELKGYHTDVNNITLKSGFFHCKPYEIVSFLVKKHTSTSTKKLVRS